MYKTIFKLVKEAYNTILRPLVVDHIRESKTKVDDKILAVLDSIFNYEE